MQCCWSIDMREKEDDLHGLEIGRRTMMILMKILGWGCDGSKTVKYLK